MEVRILNEFRSIVGKEGLITEREQLSTYECDGLTMFRVLPLAVLLPTSTGQVQAIVRVCCREKIPFVARGSGTGLSGGALPVSNGIVISLTRMNRILEVDLPNQRVVVEPGVMNLNVTARVAPEGYFYAPDPSSQQVCSIGGNVAENSGGVRFHNDARSGHGSRAPRWLAPPSWLQDRGPSWLRLDGSVRWIRRHAGHRHQSHPSHYEEARSHPGVAGGF